MSDPTSDTTRRPIGPIILVVAATIAVAVLGGLVSGGTSDPWYVELDKAPLTPPGITFGIVWPILYTLMALGAALVVLRAGSFAAASAPLGIFFTQLALNLSWSWVFFGFHAPTAAFVVIVALWIMIVVMMRSFARYSLAASLLQIPYILWVSFAAYLNLYVVVAN